MRLGQRVHIIAEACRRLVWRSGPNLNPQPAAALMLNSLDVEGLPQATRVVVAMSGGVDSSVTAALLKAEGYDVVGVTLQLYDHGAATHRKGACCAGQDIHDARAVAERIGIPHYVLDYESRFKEMVIDRFAESYVRGRDAGAVRRLQHVDQVPRSARRPRATSAPRFWRPATTSPRAHCRAAAARSTGRARKSATRAISCSPPRASSSICLRFPLGERGKAETRELARRFGLSVADKHDSQDICFVPSGRYTEVIERLKPGAAEPGDIVDISGKVLGRHHGIIHFTVGQRSGLGIAAGHPLYVVRLDAASRRVVVGPREVLRTFRMTLRDVNWLGDGTLDQALADDRREVFVKVRSTRPPQPAWLSQHRRPDRGRTDRRRGRRVARTGLRVLRRAAGPGARAGRRLHPERGGGATRPRRWSRSRPPAALWADRCADQSELLRRSSRIGGSSYCTAQGRSPLARRRAESSAWSAIGCSAQRGHDGGGTRHRNDRQGVCALGADLRFRLRRGVRCRPQGVDRRRRAASSAGASSTSASAPASR